MVTHKHTENKIAKRTKRMLSNKTAGGTIIRDLNYTIEK